jgi:hypothetical protein
MYQEVPIPAIHLFPQLDQQLMDLLRSLAAADWEKQTVAPAWKVKDIAAHLLDGNIRSLSSSRDGFFGKNHPADSSYSSLVTFLNQLNNEWVSAMQRVSPQMLTELLDITNRMYREHLAQLPPFDRSLYPVSWAGEAESQNWFHIAREYTEKWHHQQQIREAIGGPSPLFDAELFKPYLETSLRAVPYHIRNVAGEDKDTFSLFVSGEGDLSWQWMYLNGEWKSQDEKLNYSVTKIHIDDRVIWRLLSGQISDGELRSRIHITGKPAPAEAFLQMRAVMV